MHLWQKMQNPQLSALCESKAKSFYYVRQFWIVNYYFKSPSNNLSNENRSAGVSREMIIQKSSFWRFNSRFALKTTETPVFLFSLLRLCETFDVIIDDPLLTS